MNKTEAAYAMILEVRKRAGEIRRFEWEGITLRWSTGLTLTPDFVVWFNDGSIGFHETKGPFIQEDARVKYMAAKSHWPEHKWEMHQLKNGTWSKIA